MAGHPYVQRYVISLFVPRRRKQHKQTVINMVKSCDIEVSILTIAIYLMQKGSYWHIC